MKLQEQLHKTVVMVTHDMAEAGKMADEIVLLVQGQIAQQGSLRDILLHPASEQVRAFLGGQGHGLALEALRLESVLSSLGAAPPDGEPVRLLGQTTLGQTLGLAAGGCQAWRYGGCSRGSGQRSTLSRCGSPSSLRVA